MIRLSVVTMGTIISPFMSRCSQWDPGLADRENLSEREAQLRGRT